MNGTATFLYRATEPVQISSFMGEDWDDADELVQCAALLGATSVAVGCAPSPVGSSLAASPESVAASGASLPNPACARNTGNQINAPLAEYGDLDSATLSFAAGSPPAAVLCGTFVSVGVRQVGSATSTAGHLAYLFTQINPTKVSTGGGYYWIGGAVDPTVASVMLSFPETPTASPVELVSLTAGWRGFVFEYSPGPTLPSYSPVPTTVTALPADATMDVSAVDKSGSILDARHVELDTGAVRQIRPAAHLPQPTH